MIRTQARLFLKLIKPEESEINKNEESIAPTKIYRPKKKKKMKTKTKRLVTESKNQRLV